MWPIYRKLCIEETVKKSRNRV